EGAARSFEHLRELQELGAQVDVLAARLGQMHEQLRPARKNVEAENDAELHVVGYRRDGEHVRPVERLANRWDVARESRAEVDDRDVLGAANARQLGRSEEHTSELQSA